jgi:hypothetical protein
MPSVLNEPEIEIIKPSGAQNVTNPLYRYNFRAPLDRTYFPNGTNVYDGFLANYMYTVRSPDTEGGNTSDPVYANEVLASDNLKSRTVSKV